MLFIFSQHVHWSSSLVNLTIKSNFYELLLIIEDIGQVTMEIAGQVTNNMLVKSLVGIDGHGDQVSS